MNIEILRVSLFQLYKDMWKIIVSFNIKRYQISKFHLQELVAHIEYEADLRFVKGREHNQVCNNP